MSESNPSPTPILQPTLLAKCWFRSLSILDKLSDLIITARSPRAITQVPGGPTQWPGRSSEESRFYWFLGTCCLTGPINWPFFRVTNAELNHGEAIGPCPLCSSIVENAPSDVINLSLSITRIILLL
ncbi:hypothetical protein AFLA_008104 [Aspergillus flavus NRRL3357]|nr:hypothetical protein AFLA_008104 [Aspergillus flavus NRRL3357]